MKISFTIHKTILLAALSILCLSATHAQTTDESAEFQTRLFGEFVVSPLKKLDLSVEPQVRLDEQLQVSKYFVQFEAEYKLVSFLELNGNYRYIINPRPEKDTEYLNQYRFGLTVSEKFDRFTPSVRILYSNYADDSKNGEYLRAKIKLKYNIKDCKLSPYVAAEAFQEFPDLSLYKWRLSAGSSYKINKRNKIELYYKFDGFSTESNKHIVGLGYRFKL